MKAVDFFMRAETQLRQLWGQSLETIEEKPIKVVLSTINYELANIYGLMKDVKKSRLAYTESANYDPSNKNALISLARMLFTSGDFEGAQQQCNNMLKADIADEEAMMMMSEIQCQKHEFAEAMQSLKKLLTDYPISWSALVLLIELTRRLGKPLVDLDPLVEKASSAIFSAKFNDSKGVSGSGDSSNAPGARLAGLAYCKGLLNRYKRNLKEALNQFNRSRFDPVFAERSVVHMVDIYLNTADITKDIESTEEGAQASMSSVMVVNTLLEVNDKSN
jgi:tetratricopeptide (TPR) repeat protein